jgi:hypothetical protein
LARKGRQRVLGLIKYLIKAALAIGSSTVARISFSRQQLIPIVECQFFAQSYLLIKY